MRSSTPRSEEGPFYFSGVASLSIREIRVPHKVVEWWVHSRPAAPVGSGPVTGQGCHAKAVELGIVMLQAGKLLFHFPSSD